VLEITQTGLNDYRGTYDEYVARCGDDHLDSEAAVLRVRREKRKSAASRLRADPTGRARGSEAQAPARAAARRGHRRRRAGEARIAEIDALFCADGFFERTEPERVRACRRAAAAAGQGRAATGDWERLSRSSSSLKPPATDPKSRELTEPASRSRSRHVKGSSGTLGKQSRCRAPDCNHSGEARISLRP